MAVGKDIMTSWDEGYAEGISEKQAEIDELKILLFNGLYTGDIEWRNKVIDKLDIKPDDDLTQWKP